MNGAPGVFYIPMSQRRDMGHPGVWGGDGRAVRVANAHLNRDGAAVKMGHPGFVHTHVSEVRHGAPGGRGDLVVGCREFGRAAHDAHSCGETA